MAKSNFHIHTIFSDGKNSHEDYVVAALKKGMESIGFSDHVPIHLVNNWSMKHDMLDAYFAEITRLKQKYLGQIEIYAGFEMDYLTAADPSQIKGYLAYTDYTIGSVHYLYGEKSKTYFNIFDVAAEADLAFKEIGNGNSQEFVRAYYREIMRIIREFQPTIVGHLDFIKILNKDDRYFDVNEDWYLHLIDTVLDAIAMFGTIVEVNTGGIEHSALTETYPAMWILKQCWLKNIPIVLTSDAHQVEDIDAYYTETIAKLRAIGFTKQKMLKVGRWVEVEL